MGKTSIEWTDSVWNPVTGCDRVSPGCDHCYALTLAKRLKAMGSANYQNDGDPTTSGPGFGVTCHPHMLGQPLRWRRPRRIFVNSMSDLFHPDVPFEFIARVFAIMADCQHHTFQVLTKRPQRMADVLATDRFLHKVCRWRDIHDVDGGGELWSEHDDPWPLPNVWVGTSIESDRYTWRAKHLRATPAAVRFISAEPLLGPLPSLDLTGIDWLIVGGESGPGARPMHPDWVRDLRDRRVSSSELALMQEDHDQPVPSSPDSGESRSRAERSDGESAPPRESGAPPPEASSYACERPARTAFHFKQWGQWLPYEQDPQPPFWMSQNDELIDGHHLPDDIGDGHVTAGWVADMDPDHQPVVYRSVGKHAAGRMLDGRTWDEFPQPVEVTTHG